MIQYLIEFALLYGFFGLVYAFLLRKSTHIDIRRYFISGSLLFSLFIPILPHYPTSIGNFSIQLPAVQISDGLMDSTYIASELTAALNKIDLVILSIAFISLVLIARLIYGLYRVYQIVQNGRREIIHQQKIIFSQDVNNPCSFLSYILLPENHSYSNEELDTIILHESLHITFLHSVERIIFEIQKSIFWWHPSSWYFTKEISLVHEYQVDAAITKKISDSNYKETLLQFILHPAGLRMVNPFSSNIKKRINMMNANHKNLSPLNVLLLLFLFIAGSMMIHSCQSDNATAQPTLTSSDSDKPLYFEREVIDTVTTFDMDTKEESINIMRHTDKVYHSPESMPVFPGCEDGVDANAKKECSQKKLLEFVYSNVKYPVEAKDQELEGTVVTQFTVSNGGYVTNVEVIKSPHESLSGAVREMMQHMNDVKWTPGVQDGKNVSVQYTLPVRFKLK